MLIGAIVLSLILPWNTFPGRIGDVRIWRVARSQEQIVENMHVAIDPATPGLVAD
jgi:hypothetical protein